MYNFHKKSDLIERSFVLLFSCSFLHSPIPFDSYFIRFSLVHSLFRILISSGSIRFFLMPLVFFSLSFLFHSFVRSFVHSFINKL